MFNSAQLKISRPRNHHGDTASTTPRSVVSNFIQTCIAHRRTLSRLGHHLKVISAPKHDGKRESPHARLTAPPLETRQNVC